MVWAELQQGRLLPAGSLFAVHVPSFKSPVWLRAGTSDLNVFWQIFGRREVSFFQDQNARYIIDAGANIGLTSVFLANVCPDAEIDALEVDSANAELLRRNTADYPRINVIQKGLWRHSGHIKILNPEAAAWAYQIGEAGPGDANAIQAICVSDLLHQRGRDAVDLLKIDIEGAEREVFDELAKRWIERVNVLAIELHDQERPGCRAAVEAVAASRTHTRDKCGEYEIFRFT